MSFTFTVDPVLEEKQNRAYKKLVQRFLPKEKIVTRMIRSFFVGGMIAVLAQGLTLFCHSFLGFSEEVAKNASLMVLVALSCLLTGWKKFDDIAQWAGAGTMVPITGFANSVVSSALEHRTEGWVLGVAGNMFRLAGAILVFGVIAAFAVALIQWILWGIFY